jgi:hypothetical protein
VFEQVAEKASGQRISLFVFGPLGRLELAQKASPETKFSKSKAIRETTTRRVNPLAMEDFLGCLVFFAGFAKCTEVSIMPPYFKHSLWSRLLLQNQIRMNAEMLR